MPTNTPIDEYNFWKHYIEEKQKSKQFIDSRLFELLALAEEKKDHYIAHYLARNHGSNDAIS